MTALTWYDMGGGVLEAQGDSWTYLIAADSRQVVLTRFDSEVAGTRSIVRQAALNAIGAGGAYEAVPEAVPAVTARLRQLAQQYEAGIDIDAYPAWRHGYVPEGS